MSTILRAGARALAAALASLVAPSRCAACDEPAPWATAFCPACASTLVRARNPDDHRLAAFVYGAAIAEALRRFKFDDRPDLAPALLAGLVRHSSVRVRDARPDLVVPVPLHPSRLVERGYNQSALLARPLARALGIPWAARALARVVATERQTELARTARASNVERAFVATRGASLSGRRVLLVDDVETTGATLDACRRAVMAGGASDVLSVVVARAEAASGP